MNTPLVRTTTKPVEFKVLAVSSNANSFGLHSHILVTRDGRGFRVLRARGPWQKTFYAGDTLFLSETTFLDSGNKTINWGGNGFECPESLVACPAKALKEIWGNPAVSALS